MNLFASRTRRLGLIPLLLFLIGALPLFAAEPVDHAMVTRIRQEGLRRSQVMETLTALTEEVGPRLTGSPGYIAATAWAEERFRGWGFERVYQEEIPFGEGWSFSRTSVHALAPFAAPLHALPLAWSVGTDGPVRGLAIRGRLASEADFEALRGKLRGKVLFVDPDPEEVRGPAAPRDPAEERPYRRYDRRGSPTWRPTGSPAGGSAATGQRGRASGGISPRRATGSSSKRERSRRWRSRPGRTASSTWSAAGAAASPGAAAGCRGW